MAPTMEVNGWGKGQQSKRQVRSFKDGGRTEPRLCLSYCWLKDLLEDKM